LHIYSATYREAYDLALSVLNSQRIELNRLVYEVEIKPCAGDPVANPEIAPQLGGSGMSGGLHGTCTRSGLNCPGNSSRKMHDGVDLKNPFGAPVFAMYDGTARSVVQYKKGTSIIIRAGYHVSIVSTINGDRVRNVYFHLQEANRASGAVKAGDIIGYQGVSGNLGNAIAQGSTTSHLHIKTRVNGGMANPLDYLATTINANTGSLTNPCN
jgi:murein DD-endopeptidase MepM/ murein hydrolase activator NlpD